MGQNILCLTATRKFVTSQQNDAGPDQFTPQPHMTLLFKSDMTLYHVRPGIMPDFHSRVLHSTIIASKQATCSAYLTLYTLTTKHEATHIEFSPPAQQLSALDPNTFVSSSPTAPRYTHAHTHTQNCHYGFSRCSLRAKIVFQKQCF